MVGKWHLGFHEKKFTPLSRGFDNHTGYWGEWIDYYSKTCQTDVPYKAGLDFRNEWDVYNETSTYATDLFTNAAIKYIENHNKSHPMFMIVNHVAPHAGNGDVPLKAPQDEIDKFQYITIPTQRTYAAMISSLDKSVGRIMTALKAAGMLENAVVGFMSDNGAPTIGPHSNGGSNYPFRGLKSLAWEGGVRTVGLIWSNKIPSKKRVFDHMFHVTDWLPTILAGAGINVTFDSQIDGINQWNTLMDTTNTNFRTELLVNIDPVNNSRAVIKDNWKLIQQKINPIADLWLSGPYIQTNQNAATYKNAILQSEVNVALGNQLTNNDIINIPKLYRVRCPITALPIIGIPCIPIPLLGLQYCLFNLAIDPCEKNNVAVLNPTKLTMMINLMEQYESEMVPVLSQPTDPNCDPKYFNNTWVNWNDFPPHV